MEREWLTGSFYDRYGMHVILRDYVKSNRKKCLFAIAACRMLKQYAPGGENRAGYPRDNENMYIGEFTATHEEHLATAERYADGIPTFDDKCIFTDSIGRLRNPYASPTTPTLISVIFNLCTRAVTELTMDPHDPDCAEDAVKCADFVAYAMTDVRTAIRGQRKIPAEERPHEHWDLYLLRKFVNPSLTKLDRSGEDIKVVKEKPRFSTNTVQLATALYNGENTAAPLHDSLLDDGYEELSTYFENESSYPKGYGALDLILGKR